MIVSVLIRYLCCTISLLLSIGWSTYTACSVSDWSEKVMFQSLLLIIKNYSTAIPAFKTRSHWAKANEKATICFNVCHLFDIFIFFAVAPTFAWCERILRFIYTDRKRTTNRISQSAGMLRNSMVKHFMLSRCKDQKNCFSLVMDFMQWTSSASPTSKGPSHRSKSDI